MMTAVMPIPATRAVHSSPNPNFAPAWAQVAIPDGPSSEASCDEPRAEDPEVPSPHRPWSQ
jgi:hypothetical protein